MPLRDHFRPPLLTRRSWAGFQAQWLAVMVIDLNRRLPPRYLAEPQVHPGSAIEIDVGTFEEGGPRLPAPWAGGGAATAVWAPPSPTLAVAAELPDLDEYEVLVFDTDEDRRLVAAVELVSPANKDRPERRRAFVAKCSGLLREQVCVAIVDLVTTRTSNLFGELLEQLNVADSTLGDPLPPTYAVSCRFGRRGEGGWLEAWAQRLEVGRALPTLPLWLAADLAVPLELESSYEETCRILRLP